MPTNEAEKYLGVLAERSFLKLWTIPNPFKKAGKELTDLLVVFGNDLIIISDKAHQFGDTMPLAWERWRRHTIEASLKQLNAAARSVADNREIYLDNRATTGLPIPLPTAAERRLHLISVVRPAHNPQERPANWKPLRFNSDTESEPFTIGAAYVSDSFVHIFDGETIEFLLTQLDTAPDFLRYLKSREQVLRTRKHITFSEKDLFATALNSWRNGGGFTVVLPPPDAVGRITLPSNLWDEYVASDGATLTKSQYANSKNIDILIDHFHKEYDEDRALGAPKPTYDSHERAMRMLASESRFSRRLIADGLIDLLKEEDNTTFWAATVPSPDFPDVRYLWLTYPERPAWMSLQDCEQLILSNLRQHLFVARLTFGCATYVGIAGPNRNITMLSYSICILDGANWSAENEAEAQLWKSHGVFANLEATHRFYRP